MERTSETKPVTIVAIGAGNRTNKYLEYAIRSSTTSAATQSPPNSD